MYDQNKVIRDLAFLARAYGYEVETRKKLRRPVTPGKQYRPDVVARRPSGRAPRCFEVEGATVSNYGVSKSWWVLADFLLNNRSGLAYIVVPDDCLGFTKGCDEQFRTVLRKQFGASREAIERLRLSVLSYGDVKSDVAQVRRARKRGSMRCLPKCRFFAPTS